MDDTGIVGLDTLCGARVGCVFHFDSRARWWAGGGNDGAEQSAHGSICVALGFWLVSSGPDRIALRNASRAKREPRTRSATRLGAFVCVLLDVLAGADAGYGSGVVVVGIVPVEYLAGRTPRRAHSGKALRRFTQRRIKRFGRAFASLRSLRLCVKLSLDNCAAVELAVRFDK